jgi:hypothetical protein
MRAEDFVLKTRPSYRNADAHQRTSAPAMTDLPTAARRIAATGSLVRMDIRFLRPGDAGLSA